MILKRKREIISPRKYADGGEFDNSKLTYRKNLKLNKSPFSVDKSSRITGSKKLLNGETKYTTENKSNLSSLIPYASNISNAFRKLPKPIASQLESPVNANLINLDAARNNIDTEQRNLNRETDYKVSNPAVSQAIKATILGKTILGKNNLAQEEANSNAQIKNQTNQFNQVIQARNIERGNEFNRENIQRDIAQQNLLSENLADVGNKYQEQQRDKSLIELENRKLSYLPEFYNKNEGHYQRFENRNPNTKKETYALGGIIDPTKKSITKNDFTLIPWSKQGVNDSTGRAPLYKTTNAAFYNLNKAPIPQGVNPNDETYSQIDSLDRKLSSISSRPIISHAKDVYGDTALGDQGRVVSDYIRRKFKLGGEIEEYAKGGWIKGAVNPAHKGYCTPMTKSTCTPRRKAFAMTMKKHHGFH